MNGSRTFSIPGGINRRRILGFAAAIAIGAALPAAAADDKVVVGVVLPLSGAFADQGSHYETGMRLYQKVHGTKVAGKEVELVVRDDQGPGSGDLARRLTQELILRNGANIILGYSFTPNAMSVATLLTEAKIPAIIVNAATSSITTKSDYFTRVSMTLSQVTYTLGKWAASNGIGSAYTIVSDYAPGIDAETWFTKGFTEGGGKVLGSDRTPVAATEYGPFLQRAIEARPGAIFAFNPGGDVSIAFMKQSGERLKGTGIKLMVTGDVVDDNLLPAMGSAVQDVISAWHYQEDVDTPENKAFLEAFRADHEGAPSYRVLQGYDGMDMIYKALEETGGDVSADALMSRFKGMKLASPRGPILIEPDTRDITQNIYIRKGEFVDGKGSNNTIAVVDMVRDPAK
jgi:branched-chain amino acid transport system substrate-binding protein